MGRAGDCKVCGHRDRGAMEGQHAQGVPTRAIARDHGVPEPSLRRHFAHMPSKKAAPVRPTPGRGNAWGEPSVSFSKVRQAAQYLGVPLSRFAACVINHLDRDILTATEAELDELHAAWAAADEDEDYCATIIRNGKFLEETAGR